MANFYDAVTEQPITSLQVRKGTKFKIGLYGGGPPPDNAALNVTTNPGSGDALKNPDPAVRQVSKAPGPKYIYEIDPAKMGANNLRACLDGKDYFTPLKIDVITTLELRKSIVTLARSFVAKAHYLWGTAGNEPDIPNGNAGGGKISAAKMRAMGADSAVIDRDKVLAINTAVQPVFDGYNTCAGRCNRYKSETPDLAQYLKDRSDDIQNGVDPSKWAGAGSGKNLFPRKYYFRNNIQNGGAAVWGESCIGVRHFDCVGLVNYCYARHWYTNNFGMDIKAFRNAIAGTTEITDDKNRMDADILIKTGDGHIGMLYQGEGDRWYVVQATDTRDGLSDTELYSSGDWDRYRMSEAYLLGEHKGT